MIVNSRPSDTPRCRTSSAPSSVRLPTRRRRPPAPAAPESAETRPRRAPGRRGTRARRPPGRAGRRAGTCPASRPTTCTENSLSRLACSDRDADDEERAEADREQDDARLVARPRQVQHRVAQRKRPRIRQRRDQRDQRPAGQVQHDREPREAGAHDDADLERRRLPRGERDQRQRHGHEHREPGPVARAGAASRRAAGATA